MARRRRRLGRIVLTALTALSLLLCAGSLAMWLRGRDSTGVTLIAFTRGHTLWRVVVKDGVLTTDDRPQRLRERQGTFNDWANNPLADRLRRTGKTYDDALKSRQLPAAETDQLRAAWDEARAAWEDHFKTLPKPRPLHTGRTPLPLWLVFVGSALLPIVRVARWDLRRLQRTDRRAAGLCLRCGYNLRATLDRCPECGTATGAG